MSMRKRGELAKLTDGIEHSLPQFGIVPECVLNEFSINFDLHRLNTILDLAETELTFGVLRSLLN